MRVKLISWRLGRRFLRAEGVLRGDFEISKTVSVSVAEDTEGFTFTQEASEEPTPEPEPETAAAGDES